MPDNPQSIPNLETAFYSEQLRRQFYDIAVEIVFYNGSPIPDHTPDECDLTVFYLYGRWFATWRDLESESDAETPLPLARVWQVVRLQNDAHAPLGVVLHEV
jgi:hypothetical protein